MLNRVGIADLGLRPRRYRAATVDRRQARHRPHQTGLILDHHKELRIGAVVDRQGRPQFGIYGQAERALWQRP